MNKQGWNDEKGLGASGQGRLDPIPTRFKPLHDRLGVGHVQANKQPLRVTHHFPVVAARSARKPKRGERRQLRRMKEEQEKVRLETIREAVYGDDN